MSHSYIVDAVVFRQFQHSYRFFFIPLLVLYSVMFVTSCTFLVLFSSVSFSYPCRLLFPAHFLILCLPLPLTYLMVLVLWFTFFRLLLSSLSFSPCCCSCSSLFFLSVLSSSSVSRSTLVVLLSSPPVVSNLCLRHP